MQNSLSWARCEQLIAKKNKGKIKGFSVISKNRLWFKYISASHYGLCRCSIWLPVFSCHTCYLIGSFVATNKCHWTLSVVLSIGTWTVLCLYVFRLFFSAIWCPLAVCKIQFLHSANSWSTPERQNSYQVHEKYRCLSNHASKHIHSIFLAIL